MGKFVDLTGQKFGKLTVIGKGEVKTTISGNKYLTHRCQCDCGNIVDVATSALKRGNTKSCGCSKGELISSAISKDLIGNKYGRLTVIEKAEDRLSPYGYKYKFWKCQCECGSIVEIQGNSLLSGATQSCGCLRRETTREKKFQDLTGQRFGRLTVIKEYGHKKQDISWLCKCDCGNECIVIGNNLRKGNSQSCGCIQKEITSKRTFIDLTGQTFGRLTVLKRVEDYISPSNHHCVQYLCKCECGNDTITSGTSLLSGRTKSCGCMVSYGETNIKNFLNENKIDFEKQKTFKDLYGTQGGNLSYDFYLPQYDLLIEYQGIQHTEPVEHFGGEEQFKIQQEHDKRKREYAHNNGYDLLEIWYYDYNRMEEILQNKLMKENVHNDTE